MGPLVLGLALYQLTAAKGYFQTIQQRLSSIDHSRRNEGLFFLLLLFDSSSPSFVPLSKIIVSSLQFIFNYFSPNGAVTYHPGVRREDINPEDLKKIREHNQLALDILKRKAEARQYEDIKERR